MNGLLELEMKCWGYRLNDEWHRKRSGVGEELIRYCCCGCGYYTSAPLPELNWFFLKLLKYIFCICIFFWFFTFCQLDKIPIVVSSTKWNNDVSKQGPSQQPAIVVIKSFIFNFINTECYEPRISNVVRGCCYFSKTGKLLFQLYS